MQPALLDRLRDTVGPANVLTGVELSPFVVEGRTPEAAVFPGSVPEVTGVLTAAGEAGVPVAPWGGGTAASMGRPAARPALVLGLRRLSRLIEHEPGDLTATVEAGMTLDVLQATLGRHGQWLSLDPPDPERATVGGIVATNAAGPRCHLYGTLRDLVIGVTVVTGEGAIVRGGGKVVKNVAGYDLPKLFIGSYGTLGVIVEATVKLRPRAEAERLVAVPFERMKDAAVAVRALMASDLIPSAVELLDAAAARAAELDGGGAALVVGFDGLAEAVAWQCAELERLTGASGGGPARVLPEAGWRLLGEGPRRAFPAAAAVMTFGVLPTQVADLMEQGAGVARARGLVSAWTARAGVGVVAAALGAEDGPEADAVVGVLQEWRAMARAGGGHATLEWAPLAVKASVDVWDDPGAAGRLMWRIKSQLDPKNVLNPGRFVGGI